VHFASYSGYASARRFKITIGDITSNFDASRF
jgi:hypothetical protein